jgi:hypothetical protein
MNTPCDDLGFAGSCRLVEHFAPVQPSPNSPASTARRILCHDSSSVATGLKTSHLPWVEVKGGTYGGWQNTQKYSVTLVGLTSGDNNSAASEIPEVFVFPTYHRMMKVDGLYY